MKSSGTSYVINEHSDDDQYDPDTIPSELVPCGIFFVSFVNRNAIAVELSC